MLIALLSLLPGALQEQALATLPEELDLREAVTVFAPGGSNAALIYPVGTWTEKIEDPKANETPAIWKPRTYYGKAQHQWAEDGRNGGRCLRIDSAAGSDSSWFADLRVQRSTRYRLTGWARTEELKVVGERADGASFNLHARGRTVSNGILGNQDWTQLVMDFETAADETRVSLNCLYGGWGACQGTAWFDDLELRALDQNGAPIGPNLIPNPGFEQSFSLVEHRIWRLWQNEKRSPEWDLIDGLRFSEDGTHWCYRVRGRKQADAPTWRVVHDGKEGKAYSWVGQPALRPDGKEVAYWADHRGDFFVITGNKKGKEYKPGSRPPAPVYRADGKVLAFRCEVGNGWLILVGRKEHGPYLEASAPRWSATGRSIVWAGVPTNGEGRIYAGRKHWDAVSVAVGAPAISDDGKRAAWPALRDNRLVLFADEAVLSGPYVRMAHLTYAPNGRDLAFIGSQGGQEGWGLSDRHTNVLESVEVQGRPDIWQSDNRHWNLVLNGAEVGEDWDELGQPVFSADSKRLALPVRRGEDWFMVVATVGEPESTPWQSERFDAVGPPRFLENDVQFGARRGRELLRIRSSAETEKP